MVAECAFIIPPTGKKRRCPDRPAHTEEMTPFTVVDDHLTTVNPIKDGRELITDGRLRSALESIRNLVRSPQLITDGRVRDHKTAFSELIAGKKVSCRCRNPASANPIVFNQALPDPREMNV